MAPSTPSVSTPSVRACLLRPLAFAAALACLPAAEAQSTRDDPLLAAGPALKETVVSGSRRAQDPDELPVSIDVVRRQDIEDKQLRDIRDLVRDLPNVSVSRGPARFSLAGTPTGRDQNAGFNIRGLDGNRVLMLVDGIRLPRSYAFSANSFGRDYLDIGLVQQVEVVRGATSALYGSDGMAGLVNFITAEPANFLAPGKAVGGRASVGYDGDTHGRRAGATVAGKANDTLSWMVGGNVVRSRGLETMGTNAAADTDRTVANPERDKGVSLLAKAVLTPGGGQRHVLGYEHVDKKADYDLLSARARPPLAATSVVGATSSTDMRRDRLSWDGRWTLDAPVADELQAVLSYQDADAREVLFEDRATAADRVRDVTYRERTLQANLQAYKTLAMAGGWMQKISYGLDTTRARIRNLQTGVTPAAGETFPLKRFPDTRETSTALYAQDELIAGAWSLTPGVRVDHFAIDASQAGFAPPSTTPAASISGSATSPKLGVLWRADDRWSVFGNYAAGFRAPNAGQVNAFFENVTQFYKTIPNPDLKPEKSQNLELGARGRLDRLRVEAAVFTGRYKDFIDDLVQVGGTGRAGNPLVFQSVNRGRVRIHGFELKGDMDWGRLGTGRLGTPFAYGATEGKDTATGRPVNAIDPQRLNLGARYDTAAWAVRLDMTHRAGKKAADVDGAALASQFLPPSSTTFDLSGQWRIRPDLRLVAGLYNITDRKYWNWADVRGLSSTVSYADAYTQPGRYARVSLVADF